MILGIVGHEAAKFTQITAAIARARILKLLEDPEVTHLASGHCHLGGIDIWAEEIAQLVGKYSRALIFAPANYRWSDGYKPRNMRIAEASDRVVSLVVAELPPGFSGLRHKLCYHCGTSAHVKSGACWTVKYAREQLHKPGEVIVI